MNDDDTSDESSWIDEESEYSPKSEFSKPKIVEDATRKCFELRSKEMKPGYYNTKYSKEGLPLKEWIPDSRKAYCSSVIGLKQLLVSERLSDNKYKHIKLGKIKERYSYFILKRTIENEKEKYVRTGKYYIPDLDEAVYIRKIYPDGSETLVKMEGFWNSKVNAYWDHMVILCDKMFEELMKVIHRLNYFKQDTRYA